MANTRFRAEHGIESAGNSVLSGTVLITGNTTINADAVIIAGNLTISGNLNYANVGVSGDLIPDVDLSKLGNTSNAWDITGFTIRSHGGIYPVGNSGRSGGWSSANNVQLGNSVARFAASLSSLSISGPITSSSNIVVSSNTLYVDGPGKRASINALPNTSFALTIGGAIKADSIAVDALSVDGISSNGVSIVVSSVTVTNTSPNAIDIIPVSSARAAKYVSSARQGSNVHLIEIGVVNDGSNTVQVSRYGEIFNAFLGNWTVDIAGSNLVAYFTANTAGTYIVSTSRTAFA